MAKKTDKGTATTGTASVPSRQQMRDASGLFKLLSDPTRLEVAMTLATGARNVSEMCETLGQSQPAVSHHLAIMRFSRIIEPRRSGKNNFYSLTDDGRRAVAAANTLMETGYVRGYGSNGAPPTLQG